MYFAVFDGMGGEECGEKASLIAAENASKYRIGPNPIEDLLNYCSDTNDEICRYADENDIFSMGTTATIIVFGDKGICLFNIGHSKVFRFDGKNLEQISVDHYAFAPSGRKPPLSLCLGIPASEMIIEPHVAKYAGEENFVTVHDFFRENNTAYIIMEFVEGITLKQYLK